MAATDGLVEITTGESTRRKSAAPPPVAAAATAVTVATFKKLRRETPAGCCWVMSLYDYSREIADLHLIIGR